MTPTPTPPPPRLTADQLKSIAAAERHKGWRKGRRELATDLGFESVDDLANFVRTHTDRNQRLRARSRT